MTRAADVAVRLRQELADYLYPARDWMIDSEGCDADVAIVGSGRRARLLAYALRRERIARQLLIADTAVDPVEIYGALAEPRGGMPHLDLTGGEFWVPDASFGAWLSGWEEKRGEIPAGAALRAAWAAYSDWLSGLLDAPSPGSAAITAIELEANRVRISQADGRSWTVRRLVLAGPAADLAPLEVPLSGGLAQKPVSDTSVLPDARSLDGRRVLIMGDGPDSTDWAISALADGGAGSVVQIGNERAASAEHESAIARIVRHPFRSLQPAQRDALRAAGASLFVSMPQDWARCLAAYGGRYRFVPVSKETSLPELLLAQGFNPDLIVVPGRAKSAHAACEVRSAAGNRCQLGEFLRHFKVDEGYRLTTQSGAVLPVVVFGTAAVLEAGSRARDRFLARYGLLDALETISCDFFVEDEGALFASFQEFRSSETFGGKLMENKPE